VFFCYAVLHCFVPPFHAPARLVLAESPEISSLEPFYGSTFKSGILFGSILDVQEVPSGIMPVLQAAPSLGDGSSVSNTCDLVPLSAADAGLLDGADHLVSQLSHCARMSETRVADFRLLTVSLHIDDALEAAACDTATESSQTVVTMLWAFPQSAAIESPFIVQQSHYNASMRLDLRPGTSLRAMFPVRRNSIGTVRCSLSYFSQTVLQLEDNAMTGEWYEGRVYTTVVRVFFPQKFGTRPCMLNSPAVRHGCSMQVQPEDKECGWPNSKFNAVKVTWVSIICELDFCVPSLVK
jgi:hypothetical protein